jgi:dihydroneopterin aldolase
MRLPPPCLPHGDGCWPATCIIIGETRKGACQTDAVYITGMSFYGRHGVHEEERRLGQRFIVSVTLFGDTRPAATLDDLAQTPDYAAVYAIVEKIVTGEPCRLVETLAERIAGHVLRECGQAMRVRVRVDKPGAPIAGTFASVGVEIERP